MYCLLTCVAVRCKTRRWESMNLEGSQYEIYIPLENKRNRTNHDINKYIYIYIYRGLKTRAACVHCWIKLVTVSPLSLTGDQRV